MLSVTGIHKELRDYPGWRVIAASICFLTIAGALTPHIARAQLLQGTIDGNVTDPAQAAMVGAAVVVTDRATGFTRSTVTGAAGSYTLPGLPPGTYDVSVSSAGFQTYTATGIAVTAQTVTRLDASLTVGAVSETVKVSASAATLQSDRADVHSELSSDVLNQVPVPIGRNYQMIFTTIPGVSPPQTLTHSAPTPAGLWRSQSTAAM